MKNFKVTPVPDLPSIDLNGTTKRMQQFPTQIFSQELVSSNKEAHSSKSIPDLSTGKHNDAKITGNELNYKSVFELSADVIFIADKSLKFIDVNFCACQVFGYSKQEFLQLCLTDISDEVETKITNEKINQANLNNTGLGPRSFNRKDGTAVKMEVTVIALENGTTLITGRVNTSCDKNEETCNETNQRFEYVSKATCDAIWDWDLLNEHFYLSEGFQTHFGYKLQEIKNDFNSWVALVHPEDIDRVVKRIYQLIDEPQTNWLNEYRFRKADNSYAVVTDKGFIIRGENGKAIRMVGAMKDVTQRKKEEQHLKLLESVITHTTDAVLITEAEPFSEPGPRILFVNEAFTKMTGYTATEVIGKTPRILQGPKTDRNELKKLGEKLRNWESCEITVINYKKNGEEFWLNMSISPVADETGWFTHWISIERDVTERKTEDLQKVLLATQISQLFNEPVSLNETLQQILNRLAAFGDFSLAEAWLISTDQQRINLVASLPMTALKIPYYNTTEVNSFGPGEGLPGLTWANNTTQHWQNLGEHGHAGQYTTTKMPGLLSAYGIPIMHNKRVIGAFVLGLNKESRRAENLTAILEHVGSYIGTEIKRKQLEQELNQIFSFAPDIIFVAGFDGYFKKINPAASRLLEYTEEELLALPISTFIKTDDEKKTLLEEILVTGSTYYENSYITKSGVVKWLAWTLQPSFKEGILFGVAKNITDRKNNEIRLKDLNSDLQKQTKELAISNEELEQFAYVASHDLQEPLRMVTSFLNKLENKYGDIIDEKGKKYIGFAVDGSKRMRQIILDLLEFSRIGRVEYNEESIDLNELVEEIKILFRNQIEEQKAVIQVSNLPVLNAYKAPLRQVFQNLIGNSLKYSNGDFPPQIHINAVETQTHWEFAIADNGIGISQEYFEKIFIIFQRLHNKDDFSGTGIGLAVTKKIIEKQGGKIWLESEEEKGSTFYFTITK